MPSVCRIAVETVAGTDARATYRHVVSGSLHRPVARAMTIHAERAHCGRGFAGSVREQLSGRSAGSPKNSKGSASMAFKASSSAS